MKLCVYVAASMLFIVGAGAGHAAELTAPAKATTPTQPQPAAVGAPSLDDFYEEPTFSNARLSPDGKSVLYSQTFKTDTGGTGYIVLIRDLGASKTSAVLRVSVRGASVTWLDWKDDGRVLIGVTLLDITRAGGKPTGEIIGYKYGQMIIAADRDGSNQIQLLKGNFWNSLRGSQVQLLDRLKHDDDHILAIAPNPSGNPAAWKVNVRTGEAIDVEDGHDGILGWRTDSEGRIVVRYRETFGHSFVIESRAVGQSTWSVVATMKPKEAKMLDDFDILGPTERPNEFFVAVKPKDKSEGDTVRLRIFDVATKKLSEPIWPELKYDLNDIVYDGDSEKLAGVCYTAETYVCDFNDKVTSSHYKGLATFFNHERSVTPVSISNDGHWWLLSVAGPDQPGAYYLYDKPNAKIELFANRYTRLPAEQLARVQSFSYPARDGVSIPAYLTAPAAAGGGPMPLIVMPHGGPEVRDSLQYDTWAQMLATRGYFVFQPNYRGSGGYGRAYAEAGYGQWGGRMADDVTDGVKALIRSGRADPNRICIFGASFGGYAALYAGATHPELYRCVVSWAGDSDLAATMKFERETYGRDSATYKYWLKSIGDPDKDAAALRAASPASFAATYRPPVLLIHGDLDQTVDPEQSRIMERALKRAGHDVKRLEYKYEGHTGWDTDNEKSAMAAVIKFIGANIAPATTTVIAPPPALTAAPAHPGA